MNWGQEDLGVRLFSSDGSRCMVVVGSLSDAAISCNGQTKTPVSVGADRGTPAPGGQTTAMYAAIFNIATGGAEVPYSVTQGVSVATGTIPAFSHDRIVFTTCDDNTYNTSSSAYSYVRHLRDQGHNPLMVMLDDIVYADRNGAEHDDTGYTGHKATGDAGTTKIAYDYAIAYAAQLGLLGNPTIPAIRQGHDPDRKWSYRNVPTIIGNTGDHPFQDNIGFNFDSQSSTYWAPAISVWDATYGAAMLPRLSGAAYNDHTDAMDSQLVVGDVQLLFLDRITVAEGGSYAGTVECGNAQIDRILSAAAASASPIKIICMPNCVRYLKTGVDGDITRGANEPKYNHRPAEYARLITAATTGMQALAASQGFVWFMVTGDHHNPQALLHQNAAGAVAESFVQVVVGASFGGQNHQTDASLVPGLTYDGTTILYSAQFSGSVQVMSTFFDVELLTAGQSISGSTEAQGRLMDAGHRVLWSGAWIDGQSGNLPSVPKRATAIAV